MSTPTFRWSLGGVIENVRWWVNEHPAAAIALAVSSVLIVAMFVIVARWDRRDQENRNRRL